MTPNSPLWIRDDGDGTLTVETTEGIDVLGIIAQRRDQPEVIVAFESRDTAEVRKLAEVLIAWADEHDRKRE